MKYILCAFFCLFFGADFAQAPKPKSQVVVDAETNVIINMKTGKKRKAVCSVAFNKFEYCDHPNVTYDLKPTYKIDHRCSCGDILPSSTKLKLRISTEKLHLIALNAPADKINLSDNSIKIELRKNQYMHIPLNYKGKSFSAIKDYLAADSIAALSDAKKKASYIGFNDKSSIIPSKEFASLDSLVIALKNTGNTQISLIGYAPEKASTHRSVNLSRSRVYAIQNYLLQAGIDQTRININWSGSKSTFIDDETISGPSISQSIKVRLTKIDR